MEANEYEYRKRLKSMIMGSIDARDDSFKSSEIWKILRGLQLLGIRCNNISVAEMERCLSEAKKSADIVKLLVPYDFPFDWGINYPGMPVFRNVPYKKDKISNYQETAWNLAFPVFDPKMVMDEDYRKLQGLAQAIYYKMCAIEDRECGIEAVNEVNKMIVELKKEALQISERINNGEKELRKAWWNVEYAHYLEDDDLPSTNALWYLYDGFGNDLKVDDLHIAIANGECDLFFCWDEEKAYEVTDGDTTFISREYAARAPLPSTADCTSRLNGFHEYLINRIKFFIDKLAKLEDNKDSDSIDNSDYDLLKFTVDYINNNFLNKFNEEDAHECKKRPEGLLLIK